MRALRYERYGSPDVLAVVDVDEPVPRAGELKVRVRAASLNPLDGKIRAGHLRYFPMSERPPRGVGVDFAGEVVGIRGGRGAAGFYPGARVFGSLSPFRRAGSFAELAVMRTGRVAPIPAGIDDVTAAALPIAAGTAVQALTDDARLTRGMRVLVNGAAGGVGHFAVQYAKHLGAHVTASCGPSNVDFVAGLGADTVVDYTREDAAAGNDRYDVILDAASTLGWRRCRNVLAPDGVYLGTGPDAGTVAATIVDAFSARIAGRQRVVNLLLRGGADAWRRLAKLADAKVLVPHVRATIGLAEVADAMRSMEAGHGRGKVVVDPSR